MTTPLGTISLNDVNVELGKSGTTTIALGDSDVRGLAGVAGGTVSMDNLRGKSNRATISYTFSSHTANASLNLSAISGYISGKSDITVTVNSGIYLYATSTGSYGLNITGGTTGDTLTIVNNGFIMGQGGAGGTSASGANGGPALNLGFGMSACTINNTSSSAFIGGGGGGGGGSNGGGGGGAGGGAGGASSSGAAGGVGGSIGGAGGSGASYNVGGAGGGGGGRIFPGSGGGGGTASYNSMAYGGGGGGAGGGGGGASTAKRASNGVAGGGSTNPGAAGPTGFTAPYGGAGGGGWGASGGIGKTVSGGAGGKAINTNGKSITWTSGDIWRIYGAVS